MASLRPNNRTGLCSAQCRRQLLYELQPVDFVGMCGYQPGRTADWFLLYVWVRDVKGIWFMDRLPKPAVILTAITLACGSVVSCSHADNSVSSDSVPPVLTPTASEPASDPSTAAGPSPTDSAVGLLIKASDVGPDYRVQGAPTSNRNGAQPGAQAFFIDPGAHRAIADVITIFPDPAAAAAQTASQSFDQLSKDVPGVKDEPIDVGTNGRLIQGVSPNQKATIALVFSEGGASVYMRFRSSVDDPTPTEEALDIARKQDAAIKSGLPG